jgi:uncharacterized membrane protein
MRPFLLLIPAALLAGCGSSEPEPAANAANAANVAVALPKGPMLGPVDLSLPVRAQGGAGGWTLDVAPGRLLFRARGDDAPTDFYPVMPDVQGGRAAYATQDPAGDRVTIVLTDAKCGQGGAAPLTAELRIGGRALRGCAGPKAADAPSLEPEPGNATIANAAG